MPTAVISLIKTALPGGRLTNDDLTRLFPDWSAEKIFEKTGIRERRIAAADETAADLAFQAAEALLAEDSDLRDSIDALILCTQSGDHILPPSACLLQERLRLRQDCFTFEFNHGCSGYVYGLALARSLILAGQSKRILLLTADTYSKFIHPQDRSVRTLFGDAAAATLVTERGEITSLPFPCFEILGPGVFGSDGSGGANLIIPNGGCRNGIQHDGGLISDASGSSRTSNDLYMNGPEIFTFTLKTIPPLLERLLMQANLTKENLDLCIFHQANQYMLEHLRKKLKIPAARFPIVMENTGNTVSSTIPLALTNCQVTGILQSAQHIALVGFGVGYSWGGLMLRRFQSRELIRAGNSAAKV